ncbi:MAG: hypothetical protein CMO30_15290 [Tistrella sp.]|uniref:hypothetical protein n=1 Tax=Tistrella sp. TaxID=2024861 RepID=UPI000C418560|nr:hypothetical protein [Tistrella sp.]MAD39224.1 hypothetical protein [Tistrella sp.]MBA76578.1 hypothetical protein [Tistrella sp.]MBA76632.1 hypothetical protein [Tistrella sp.]|tara:strand:+ start:17196 stop:17390 length:195 start_codon:yes stop_codon:yes gene_type:complete
MPQRDPPARRRPRKKQISLTVAPELLTAVDALADQRGLSRAAMINLILSDAVTFRLTGDATNAR